MANHDQDWDDLGRSIQNLIDQAVHSQDYQKLSQSIHQVVDRAVDIGSEAVRKVMDAPSRAPYQEVKRPVPEKERNPAVLYGSTGGKTAGGVAKVLCGVPLSLASLTVMLQAIASQMLVLGNLVPIVMVLALLGAGAWLICSGITTLEMLSRFKVYRRLLGQKTQCSLERLSRSVGKNVKFVRREVQQMINMGLFREGHLDKEQTCLITSNETFRHFEESRRAFEERQRQEAAARAEKTAVSRDPQLQEVLNRGDTFIAQIRKCNDDIPGEEISEKISHMEMIVRRIFQRAEEHPEIVPDLKKLMDYYLPMTVKLLNAYADMDAQPIQGETILASKQEIEKTLDTLNLAFEKLLDDLFRDTAMDVSSDISVLNTLLAQEGLAEDDFSRIKKTADTLNTSF